MTFYADLWYNGAMKVIRADVMGWCFGVRRAVSFANSALQKKHPVYSLGDIIHNPIAMDLLAERGLVVLGDDSVDDVPNGGTAVIRAHGASPDVIDALNDRGITVIDATCPRVRASQKIAAKYARHGRVVIFAGDKNHAEAASVLSYAAREAAHGASFMVVQDQGEAQKVAEGNKAVLLAQTTFNESQFKSIAEILKPRFLSLVIKNTICPATRARQESLEELCSEVDGVLVVGSKTSANTKRLLLSAQKLCGRSALVESAEDIPSDYFSLATVGITAGASTPDNVIDEVENALNG